MTQPAPQSPVVSWTEPEGLNPRGTIIVIPGRGESPDVYERFGRRLAVDACRVHAVASPVEDPAATEEQIGGLLDGPRPLVLAGSDTGALFAVGLVASGRVAADALVLAGLPTVTDPADPVSPLCAARERYAAAPHAELVSIAGGRHDAFNDITHRTAAATIVLFLERLRLGAGLPPIAVPETL